MKSLGSSIKKRKRSTKAVQGNVEVAFEHGLYVTANVDGVDYKGVLFPEHHLAEAADQGLVPIPDEPSKPKPQPSTERRMLRSSSKGSDLKLLGQQKKLAPFPAYLHARLEASRPLHAKSPTDQNAQTANSGQTMNFGVDKNPGLEGLPFWQPTSAEASALQSSQQPVDADVVV